MLSHPWHFHKSAKPGLSRKKRPQQKNYNFSKLLSFTKISVTEVGFATSKAKISANTFEKENKLPTYPAAEEGRISLSINCASTLTHLWAKLLTSSWHSQALVPHPLSLADRCCCTGSSASFFKTKGANSRQLCACADISVTHRLRLLLRKGEGLTKSYVPDPGGHFIYSKVSQVLRSQYDDNWIKSWGDTALSTILLRARNLHYTGSITHFKYSLSKFSADSGKSIPRHDQVRKCCLYHKKSRTLTLRITCGRHC